MASRWICGDDVTIAAETAVDAMVTTAEAAAAASAAIPAPPADAAVAGH